MESPYQRVNRVHRGRWREIWDVDNQDLCDPWGHQEGSPWRLAEKRPGGELKG